MPNYEESIEFPSVTVVGPRPDGSRAGDLIFNAPRPLHGTREWVGDFITGIFYVAVDPDHPYAGDMISRNRSLDARLLKYITREEWNRRVDAYGAMMVETYGVNLADFERREIESSYHHYMAQKGVRIIMPARGE